MHTVTKRSMSRRKLLGSMSGLVLLFSLLAIAPVQGGQQNGPEGFPDLVGGLQQPVVKVQRRTETRPERSRVGPVQGVTRENTGSI